MTLDQLLERLSNRLEEEEDSLPLSELLNLFGSRAQGPLLVLPAFIATAPTGAVPGMSIATGTIIVLVALQLLISPNRLSLPKRVTRIEIPAGKLRKSLRYGRPIARFFDRILIMRLDAVWKPPLSTAIALACIGMGALMYPLALVPFAVALPGATVLILGLAILSSDGFAALLGLALAAGTAIAAWFMIGAV